MTGLLFVALAINLRQIIPDPAHAARARETLGGLLTPPDHLRACPHTRTGAPHPRVGASEPQHRPERRLDPPTRQHPTPTHHTTHTPELGSAPNPAHIGTLGIPCAAITLLLGHGGGLYWLSPTTIVYFTWAAVNAWLLMVQASDYVN